MGITLYRGAKGTGKTLSMVKDGMKYLLEGWKVYTNLENTPFERVTSEFILSINGSSKLSHVVLIIDEIELFFDSRDWKSAESKQFSKFLQQVRKRRIIILCTAQFTNLIEIRIRQQIDTLVVCSYNQLTLICECTYIDLTSIESNPNNPKTFTIKYYAKPIFSLYNTYQLIE